MGAAHGAIGDARSFNTGAVTARPAGPLGTLLSLLFCCSQGSETELSEGQEVIFYVHLPHV